MQDVACVLEQASSSTDAGSFLQAVEAGSLPVSTTSLPIRLLRLTAAILEAHPQRLLASPAVAALAVPAAQLAVAALRTASAAVVAQQNAAHGMGNTAGAAVAATATGGIKPCMQIARLLASCSGDCSES
jgi:hypothetical protein